MILEKLRDRHERSGNVVQWNVGIITGLILKMGKEAGVQRRRFLYLIYFEALKLSFVLRCYCYVLYRARCRYKFHLR